MAQLLDELLPLPADARRRPRLGVLLRLRRRRAAVGVRPRPGHRAAGARARRDQGRPRRRACCPSLRRGLGIFRPRRPRACACRATAAASTTCSTPSRPGCGSSTASSSRWSACTTSRALADDPEAQQLFAEGEPRRAPRSRPSTPAPGRCTRAGRARASPTSTTTACCATSSTSLCDRTPEPVFCDTEANFTRYLDRGAGAAARHAAAARRPHRARCASSCRRSRA